MNGVVVANQEEAASVAAEFLSSESISPLFPIVIIASRFTTDG